MKLLTAFCVFALCVSSVLAGPEDLGQVANDVINSAPAAANEGNGGDPNAAADCTEKCAEPIKSDEHGGMDNSEDVALKEAEEMRQWVLDELTKKRGEMEKAQKCQDDLERDTEELQALNERWGKLDSKVKVAKLERRKTLEDNALTQVDKMYRALEQHYSDLQESAKAMTQKLKFQEEAASAAQQAIASGENADVGMSPAEKRRQALREKKYEQDITLSLSDQLNHIRTAMIASMTDSQKNIMNSIKSIPQLHDIKIDSALKHKYVQLDADGKKIKMADTADELMAGSGEDYQESFKNKERKMDKKTLKELSKLKKSVEALKKKKL